MRREGTSFADERIVRGDCENAGCQETGVLLYSHSSDDALLCPDCSRRRARANPIPQTCDECGATGNVWRDPVHRRNEYLCINHHDHE